MPEGKCKNTFTQLFRQNYVENIIHRLNFEIAAFCFGHESETGPHRSARTLQHFFL